MTSDSDISVIPTAARADCSALVTVSTPDCATPICRLGSSDEIVGDLTVRQLIERVISPSSLLSVQVPMTQLEAESPAALSIGELLAADSCEVLLSREGAEGQTVVALDETAATITDAQTGAGGSSFLNITLEVRPTQESSALPEGERRQVALPEVFEAETPALSDDALSAETSDQADGLPLEAPISAFGDTTPAGEPAPVEAPSEPTVATDGQQPIPEDAPAGQTEPTAGDPDAQGIVAIVAEPAPRHTRTETSQPRKENIRKSDWLRAQFLPEIQALDFSGLFVGNLGMGIREEQGRKTVVLADPARITDILLRGNSYRRADDHAKALICYQELVDMDPGNADFRFLMGQTLASLGQKEDAADAFMRAKELGHDGARKELETMKPTTQRARTPLGFLRFWRQ